MKIRTIRAREVSEKPGFLETILTKKILKFLSIFISNIVLSMINYAYASLEFFMGLIN
jgi:hypothetical protein